MITEKQFLEYEEIRSSGDYNMVTEYKSVCLELGISEGTYLEIQYKYNELKEKYNDC